MSEYARFTKDVAIIGITEVVLALRGLILLPVISKLLGAAGYGIWTQATVTVGLVEPLFLLGLTIAMVRFLAAEKNKREIQEGFYSVLCTVLICSLAFASIIFGMAKPLAENFFDGTAPYIVQMTAGILPFSAIYDVCSRFFLTFRRVRLYTVLGLGRNFGGIGLVVGFTLTGYGISGAILGLLLTEIIGSITALAFVLAQIGVRMPRFTHIRSYLRFGLPLVPVAFSGIAVLFGDRYVISYFLGVSSVGIYAAAYYLGNIVSFFKEPLARVLAPVLSKQYDEGNTAGVKKYLRYSLKYSLLLGIPSAVGLSVLSRQILRIFATEEFTAGIYLVVPIIAAASLLSHFYAVGGQEVLKLTKKTNILATGAIVAAVSNLGLNTIFVPHFGIVAAAATTFVAHALIVGIALYFSIKALTFRIDWRFIIKSLVASGVMGAVIVILDPKDTWQVLSVILLGAIIYGVALLAMKGFSKDEIIFFFELLRRRNGGYGA